MYDDVNFCNECDVGVNLVTALDYMDQVVCEAETKCILCGHESTWAYGHFAPEPKPARSYRWVISLAIVLLVMAFGAFARVSMPALAQPGANYGRCDLAFVEGAYQYFKCDTGVLVMSNDPEIINKLSEESNDGF